MLKVIYALCGLILFLLGLAFASLNAGPVTIDFYLGRGEYPLVLVLVGVLAVGTLLGALVGLGRVLRLKREIGRLRRSERLAEQEIRNLRALPLRDSH